MFWRKQALWCGVCLVAPPFPQQPRVTEQRLSLLISCVPLQLTQKAHFGSRRRKYSVSIRELWLLHKICRVPGDSPPLSELSEGLLISFSCARWILWRRGCRAPKMWHLAPQDTGELEKLRFLYLTPNCWYLYLLFILFLSFSDARAAQWLRLFSLFQNEWQHTERLRSSSKAMIKVSGLEQFL